MDACPEHIDGARVLRWSPIDDRHRITRATRHREAGRLVGPASAVAICRYAGDEGYCLFSCDDRWNVLSDTCHASLEEAIGQAEFEYEGVRRTLVRMDGQAPGQGA